MYTQIKEPTFSQETLKQMICEELRSIQKRIELVKNNIRYLDDIEVNATLMELEMMQETLMVKVAEISLVDILNKA